MLKFSMQHADPEYCCPWADPAGAAEVLKFLKDIAGSTWNEIRSQRTGGHARGRNGHRKHHEQPFDSVCAEAQSRLRDARHEAAFDELFRFRLAGPKRLWGFERAGTFYVLWWDPEHQVYPTERD